VFYRYAGLSEQNEPPDRSATAVAGHGSSAPGCSARLSRRPSDLGGAAGVLPATHFRSRGRKLMLVFEHRWSISSPTASAAASSSLRAWSAAPDRSCGG
jgi:exopolyphosphatase/guanosine-5'-triphosphate,3'-diphosphate pyrophosphatase